MYFQCNMYSQIHGFIYLLSVIYKFSAMSSNESNQNSENMLFIVIFSLLVYDYNLICVFIIEIISPRSYI